MELAKLRFGNYRIAGCKSDVGAERAWYILRQFCNISRGGITCLSA